MSEGPLGCRAAAPVLCVREIVPMIEHFVDALGFTLLNAAGKPPRWASLTRDSVEIMLLAGDYPPPAADWAAYIYVDAVDTLYEELLTRGALLKGPPVDKPYNCREFEAMLPDGRVIAFGG